MKVGLFFGTFNPIHIGHILIGSYMRDHAGLDEVWLVVSPQNPLKEAGALLDENERLKMVDLALDGRYAIKSCRIEFDMPRPSYTIDTLTKLKADFPEVEFSIIMGSDNLASLEQWRNYEEILNNYPVLVYAREGTQSTALLDHENVSHFDMLLLQVSASEIRESLANNKSVEGLLPERVASHIRENGLYTTAQ
jgi:nicotinate-nucleotide adenylyltransferase